MRTREKIGSFFVMASLCAGTAAWADGATPSDAQLGKVIAVVGREISARQIIPDYKYEPAVWGSSQVYRPSVTHTTPGVYYSHRSALWGLFGTTTFYEPGSTYTTGGYYETVSTLIKPERYNRVKSYLTQLPHTTSDLGLLQQNLEQNDFKDNNAAAVRIFKSADTAQMFKRLVTNVIETKGAQVTDQEIESLRAVEKAFMEREPQKYWATDESCGRPALYDRVLRGCPTRVSGLSSRRDLIAVLVEQWFPRRWNESQGGPMPLGDKEKLIGLLAKASESDPNRPYWKGVDELIQESNYDQFIYDSAELLSKQIQARRVNSLGGLLKKLDPPGAATPKKAIVGWNESFDALDGSRSQANPAEEAGIRRKNAGRSGPVDTGDHEERADSGQRAV